MLTSEKAANRNLLLIFAVCEELRRPYGTEAKGSRREEGRAQEEDQGRAGRGGVAHRAGATSTAQSVTADQQGAVLRPHSCSPCTQAACQHARLRPHSLPSRRSHSALALT